MPVQKIGERKFRIFSFHLKFRKIIEIIDCKKKKENLQEVLLQKGQFPL